MSASIVCGVDGSADAQAALRVAARLATQLGLRLVVAHVAEPAYIPAVGASPTGAMYGRYAFVEEVETQHEAAERLLDQVIADAGLNGVRRRTATGLAAERLAELADEEDAELIVVGSRGRGAFKAAFLGSVSNSLVGISRHPVLVVPHGVVPAQALSAAGGGRAASGGLPPAA